MEGQGHQGQGLLEFPPKEPEIKVEVENDDDHVENIPKKEFCLGEVLFPG